MGSLVCSIVGLRDSTDDVGSEKEGKDIGSDTMGGGGGVNEKGLLILIFCDGILPLKIRSGKIRLTFVESNIG